VLRISTLKRKGQLTIPVEMRSALGLHEGDAVELELEDSTLRLRPRRGTITERTAGMVRSNRPPMSAEELRVAAETAIAEDSDERSRPR
jgi:antitoxin PrlF